MARTAEALAQQATAIVPTLALHETWSRLNDQAFIRGLDLSGVPDSVRASWNVPDLIRRAGLTPSDFRAFRRSRPYQDRFVRLFHRAGGSVAAGSDAPNQLLAPGPSLHDELALLVRAGLTAEDALLAATRNAAQLVNADSIGMLSPGAVADFIVLNASPLADIANSRDIDLVVLRGTLYSPSVIMERN
jgi:imidazolonepropionase-like amidohydrolase